MPFSLVSITGTLLALVAVVTLLLRHQAAERAMWAQERSQWAEERRTLCDRIQQPHALPYRPVENYQLPEIEPDGWNEVGEIVIDPDYGLE